MGTESIIHHDIYIALHLHEMAIISDLWGMREIPDTVVLDWTEAVALVL